MFWLSSHQSFAETIKGSLFLRLQSCKGNCSQVQGWENATSLFQWQSLSISTLKWKKTTTLGRERDARNKRFSQISLPTSPPRITELSSLSQTLSERANRPKPAAYITRYHSSCSANMFSIYYQPILWYPTWRPGVNLPFLFLKPSFKLGFHHLLNMLK